jgi:hypothetical protein
MFLSTFLLSLKRRKPQRKRARRPLLLEALEDRCVPSTFTVQNLNDHGDGSLRQAIIAANGNLGADVINFNVTGTIQLTSGPLPTITDTVNIDGTTAPEFDGTPLVQVDYHGFGGLFFTSGSDGSALRSLSLVNASGAGVTVEGGGSMLIVGNFIGLGLDGTTVAGNGGNGLELCDSSSNTIGGTLPEDRNIISGNQNNGISICGSSNNQVLGNFIGTDVTGTIALGNALNGILVAAPTSVRNR